MTTLLGLSGSLRGRSYNTALLRACGELLPAGASLTLHPLDDVSLYNGDLDNDSDRPPGVSAFLDAVRAADGLLLAMPEYNHSVPGVLKNAIDWASRPAFRAPLTHKPVAIMGASPGAGGTMRGQEQLKLVLLSCLASLHVHPGVAVRHAARVFDDDLRLSDATTRDFLRGFLEGYVGWVRDQAG